MDYEKMLTKGALKSIKNNESVEDPVMQVIAVQKMSLIDEYYTLIISDGEYIEKVGVSAILNSMVSTGKLSKFSLIKINKYVATNCIDISKKPKQVIILSDLVVLVPGSIIYKTIGNPQQFSNNTEPILGMEASAPTAQVNEECSGSDRMEELEWRSLIERGLHSRLLTRGALQSIIYNVKIKCPIMQVLDMKQMIKATTGEIAYRLIISDGQHHYSHVILTRSLNHLITCGNLKKYSIICIKSYGVVNKTGGSNQNRHLIILWDLICLFICPGEIIGNPEPAEEKSAQLVVNSNPVSTDAPNLIDHEMDNLLHNLDMLHIL